MRTRGRHARLGLALATVLVAVTIAATSLAARPGGGQSYGGGGGGSGGGGSSGGGGGGGGGGDGLGILFELIFQLVFAVPEVGIPLLILVVIVLVMRSRADSKETGWDSSSADDRPAPRVQPPRAPSEDPRRELEKIRKDDPEFSVVVFEDFLQAFWGELLVKRGAGQLDVLSPWLAAGALDDLPNLGPVSTPIVGTIDYREVAFFTERVVVRVTIEGMFSAQVDGRTQSYWVKDALRLERSRQARSRAPERATVFTCPSCGAPAENARTGRCSYCHQVVNDGRFDWVLTRARRTMGMMQPPQLTSTVEERGTERPTMKAPDVQQLVYLLRDTNFALPAFIRRLHLAFGEVQAGWSEGDLSRIRPWVTDRQLESMRWWLESYAAAGLRNVSTNTITRVEPVRITRDRFYDAISVRVFATGTDYTVDARGAVVAGSKTEPRPFSEYWTMIRGRAATGAPRAEKTCPRCGAPLAIDMAGSCTHCRAHVVSGEFDWVLSRIEQDDAVGG